MNISIDYDETYTQDPQLWKWFISKAQARDHQVFCITRRYPEQSDDIKSEMKIRTLFANKSKLETASLHGIKIDVWIDDKPQSIYPLRLLNKQVNRFKRYALKTAR